MLNKLILFLPQDLSNIIIEYCSNDTYNKVMDSILYHNSILLQLNYDISGPNLLLKISSSFTLKTTFLLNNT